MLCTSPTSPRKASSRSSHAPHASVHVLAAEGAEAVMLCTIVAIKPQGTDKIATHRMPPFMYSRQKEQGSCRCTTMKSSRMP